MNANDIPVRNPHFILEKIDEELLLCHPANTEAIYMNETAALIWQTCDGQRSIEDIILLLKQSYPQADMMEDDVKAIIRQFADSGVVNFQTP